MNVLLIGYRGTGKSTVGTRLAALLGWSFVDADIELERQAGRSIREIFNSGGEAEFRDLESQTLAKLLQGDHYVLALGGGVVLREENRQLIHNPQNHVVWLTASINSIHNRIAHDPTTQERRPSLTTLGDREEIERLLLAREPLYRECATFIVDTEGKSPEAIATEIAQACGLSLR